MDIFEFWNRIKLLAREKGTTQKRLAEYIGLPYNTFRNWMYLGIIPSLDYALEFSRFFGVSLEYLIYGKEADLSGKIKKMHHSPKNR